MAKRHGQLRALAVALSFSAIACASAAKPSQPANADGAGTRDTFLWLRSIDGFNAIDDEHIVLSSGTRHALVKTFGRCDGLRYSETIALDAPLGYLDRSGVGQIVYRQGLAGVRRCPIDRIVAVKDVGEARALVATEATEKSGTR